MKTSQVRMQFMLKYEGLRIMREMQMGENPSEKRSVHEMMAEESEKTKPSSQMKKSNNLAMSFARMGSGGSGSPGGPGTFGNLLLP